MSKGFWAQVIELDDEVAPTYIAGCDDEHEAAQSCAGAFIQDTDGEWTEGAIRMWEKDGSADDALTYNIKATITPYEGDDAEEDEVECKIEVEERT